MESLDLSGMKITLAEAEKALLEGEVPVGAVLIDDEGEPRQYVDENKRLTIVRREMSETDFRQYA